MMSNKELAEMLGKELRLFQGCLLVTMNTSTCIM